MPGTQSLSTLPSIASAGVSRRHGASSAVRPESFCVQMLPYPEANIQKDRRSATVGAVTAGQTRQASLTSSLEHCRLRRRTGDRCSLDMGKRRELVVAVIGGGEDFDDSNAAHAQRIGHQRPMGAPRHRFGAHDRCASLTAQSDQLVEAVRKFLRLHVIGIAAKARVPPAGVGGVLAGVSQTAQRARGGIFDAMRKRSLRDALYMDRSDWKAAVYGRAAEFAFRAARELCEVTKSSR